MYRRFAGLITLPLGLGIAGLIACEAPPSAQPGPNAKGRPGAVAARGRLQPRGGVLRVSGPSDFVVVVGRLEVGEGDLVKAGQVLAVTDTYAVRRARLTSLSARIETQQATLLRLQAELENARVEHQRRLLLAAQGVVADTERDAAQTRRDVAEAALAEARSQLAAARAERVAAEAEAELALVRATRDGQVLKIHTHAGEKVGPDGILDMGATQRMYAVAEVYETDIARVRPGQRARVRSPALPRELEGSVERVGLEVGRLTSLGTDPGLKSDARVVEVEIRLDDGAAAASLTQLEVEVLIIVD